MSIGVHDTIYFDKIERTNKLQTLVAIANACLNIKDKEEVKKQLEYALNIFKIPKSKTELGSGSYNGTQKQWNSKYTLGRDLGLIEESRNEVVLSKLGLMLAKGEISAKYYISVVMLNYIHIVNNKIVHPVYSIVNEMESKNTTEMTKSELREIKDFNLCGVDENNYIGGLFDLLQDTYYFRAKDKNTLEINSEIFSLRGLKEIINLNELDQDIELIKEKYSKENQKEWCDYLGTENVRLKSILISNKDIKVKTCDSVVSNVDKPRNRILFGAPGTGKSYKINSDIDKYNFNEVFKRVTFHPSYTYSQFIGAYKPVSKIVIENGSQKEVIAYEFVPGVFLNVLIEALKDEQKGIPHLLVIEEINRANPAGVFGDVFQLLDRNSDGKSNYTINMPTEMKKYVNRELGIDSNNYIDELYIPNNMYIWATMNSADQGVYPMDSAFKRRWSFEYIGIDKNEEELKGKEYEFISLKDKGNTYSVYEWNTVRKAINKKLKVDGKVNEDKLLGPFFLSKTELLKWKENQEEFDDIFKSKVLMYLYEDILKYKKIDFFVEGVQTLSDIMNAYDNGKVFNFEIEKIQLESLDDDFKAAEEQSSYETKE